MKQYIKKVAYTLLVVILSATIYAVTPDAKEANIDGNWAATTNTWEIPQRQFWMYLSIKDGKACLHNLYVQKGACPSSCYTIKKGSFEAAKIKYSFALNKKNQVLVESWTIGEKPDSLSWVKYDLPTGCVHGKPTPAPK